MISPKGKNRWGSGFSTYLSRCKAQNPSLYPPASKKALLIRYLFPLVPWRLPADLACKNARIEKYLKVLQSGDGQARESTLADLHRSFTSLSQGDQKIAEIFLHDPQRTLRDYLAVYQVNARADKLLQDFIAQGWRGASDFSHPQ